MVTTKMVMITPFFLLVAQCCGAFTFVPATTKGAAALASSKIFRRRGPITLHNGKVDEWRTADADRGDDYDDNFDRKLAKTTTRRSALLGACGLSLLTTTSCLPPPAAVATDDDAPLSSAATQPFTVILAIQVDSDKPGELSEIEIECRPDWAPLAARRFRELVELGFYEDCPFFRVLPGFIAQFGVAADPNLNKRWMYCDPNADEEEVKLCRAPLRDEPRALSNKRGTLSFASSGKNSRRTQVFVNLGDNGGPPNFLDAQNFVPFARIVKGMDVVGELNAEYGGKVSQGKAAYYGGKYFEKVFPRLSVIRDAKVM